MTVTDPFGFIWLNGGGETDDHLAFGGHEPAIVEIAKSMLPKGGTFVDVGAHVGLYSIRLGEKAGHVIAVEANWKTALRLRENIRHNRYRMNAIFNVIEAAAWDSETTLQLVDENGKSTGGSTRCEETNDWRTSDPAITAEAFRLDVLLDWAEPDLIKIDVEGAEARVLRGYVEGIRAHRPTLLIEMHDKIYDIPHVRGEVIEFLDGVDYVWNDSLTYGSGYYIIAKPRDFVDGPEIEVVKAGENPAAPTFAQKLMSELEKF